MQVGDAIRTARLQRGWTQAKLHVRAGVNLSEISRIETGRLTPSPRQVARLAHALDIPLRVLSPFGSER